MKIYIASSWKNQHGIELLTEKLRKYGYEVISWIENNYEENHAPDSNFDFNEWIKTESAVRSFIFDTKGAAEADLVIYYGTAGMDAWAEIGIAYGCGNEIIGLHAKGEKIGLMRMLVSEWFFNISDLIEWIIQNKEV